MEVLDFRREGRFQDIFRRNVGKSGKDFFTAPKVHFDLSGDEVLVQEFVSGLWLWEVIAIVEQNTSQGKTLLRQLNIDPAIVARRILWAEFWSADENVFFHSDPHPANILVRPNNQLTFIDFGSCGSFNHQQKVALEQDVEAMTRASLALMEPLPPVDLPELVKQTQNEYMRVLHTFNTPAKYTHYWERTSALAPNANSAPLILIMFIIPQMVMSGALVPLPSSATAPASSRWAFQAAVAIGGAGSDVAADACWAKPKSEQDDMTLSEKNANCSCMGENALRESSCNFPGLGKYFDAAIDKPDPAKPAEPGAQPAEPKFPDPPAKPADINNVLLLQKYLADLDVYNKDVDKIRTDYQTKIDDWKKEQDNYKTAIETYQTDLTELKVKRAIAVGSAESTIRRYKDDYGWTFINKEDRTTYLNTLYTTWGAQSIIILVLFIGTVIMQKRREA